MVNQCSTFHAHEPLSLDRPFHARQGGGGEGGGEGGGGEGGREGGAGDGGCDIKVTAQNVRDGWFPAPLPLIVREGAPPRAGAGAAFLNLEWGLSPLFFSFPLGKDEEGKARKEECIAKLKESAFTEPVLVL